MSKILPSRLGQLGRVLFALALTMTALAGLGLAGQGRVSALGEVVSIDPADQAVSRGEEFTVDVMISGAENLYSYEFTLAFDPDLVEAMGVADASFLGSTGRDVVEVGPDIGDGTVTFSALTTGAMAGPDGDGVLATVTLKAIGQGTSALDLEDVTVYSGTEEREPMVENGSVDSVFAMAIDPEESIVNPGTFTVDVMIHGAMDLKGYEFSLDFDSDVLMATGVADAGFLQGTVTPIGPDIGDGTLTFAAVSTGAAELPDGDGVLATVTFDTVDYGETKLDLNGLTAFSGDTEEMPDDMDGMVYVVRAGVSVVPEATSVSRCATFEVDLAIAGDDVEDVTGFDINLDWDPALFEVTDIMWAPYMESTGRSATELAKVIDNATGTLNYAVATVGTADGPDADPPGVLAVVTLEAIGVGTSDLDLHDVLISQSGFEVEPAALNDGTAESTKEAVGFELSEIASPQVAGQPFEVTITALNEDDDPAENFSGTVDLSDTTGTLTPTSVEMEDATEDVMMTVTKAQSGIVITAETVNLCGVTISGDSNAFTIEPDVERPSRAELTPDPETVTAGDSVEYTLTAWDPYDNEFDATPDADFSIDAGAGGSFADNVYTSEFAGTWTVTGEYEGDFQTVSDDAVLTVEPGPLDEIVVEPDPATVLATHDQQFTATGYDEFGNEVPITPVWSLADPDAGTIDAAGLFTASFNIGTYAEVVVATDGAVMGYATVVVDGTQLFIPLTTLNY